MNVHRAISILQHQPNFPVGGDYGNAVQAIRFLSSISKEELLKQLISEIKMPNEDLPIDSLTVITSFAKDIHDQGYSDRLRTDYLLVAKEVEGNTGALEDAINSISRTYGYVETTS